MRTALAGMFVALLLMTFALPAAAAADVTDDTLAVLRAHPEGGAGLEAAILDILERAARHQPAQEVAQEMLGAAAAANGDQSAAIGRALASWTKAVAESNFADAKEIAAAVANVRSPGLKRAYSAALGRSVFERPEIPAGTDGGGLTSPSPS